MYQEEIQSVLKHDSRGLSVDICLDFLRFPGQLEEI